MARIPGTPNKDTLSGTPDSDAFVGSGDSDSIAGGSGPGTSQFDSLDYSGFGAANPITATFTSAFGGTVTKKDIGTDTFSGIRLIIGTQGNDSLKGFSAPTSLIALLGGPGTDSIDGASNSLNQADYGSAQQGVTIDLGQGTATDGLGSTDRLTNVLRVKGSDFNDTITGGNASEIFSASRGNDGYNGGGGSNLLDYGSGFVPGPVTVTYGASGYSGTAQKSGSNGTDSFTNIRGILGSAENDTLIGSDDASAGLPFAVQLRGRLGNDFIDGRKSQLNQASYADSPNGVTVRLQTSLDADGNWFGSASDGNQVPGAATGTYYTDTLKNVVRAVGGAGNDTLIGSDASDRFDGSAGSDSMDGGLGFNTIDYGSLASGTTVGVAAGDTDPGLFGLGTALVAKSTGGADTVVNANEFRGTAGGDILIGYDGPYSYQGFRMRGAGGNDTIYGFKNTTNSADYSNATAAVTIDLQVSTDPWGNEWIGSASGDASVGTDTLISVQRVRASSFNDTIHGTQGDDVVDVFTGGSHVLYGRAGLNEVRFAVGTEVDVTIDLGTEASGSGFGGYRGTILKPGGVTDTLYDFYRAQGGAGDDAIYGTPGDDTLSGGPGDNLLDGRGGNNTYTARLFSGQSFQSQGAVIDLGDGAVGTATNPWGGTDSLRHIQNAVGSQFDDTLTGADIAGGGLSFIRGDGGNDLLQAPSWSANVMVSYASSLSGVRVDLALQKTLDDGWFGGQDTLVNIKAARGSAFDDSLLGSDRDEVFEGRGGLDTIDGRGGRDTAVFNAASADATWYKDAETGNWVFTSSDGQVDVLRDVEFVRFTDRTIALPDAVARQDLDGGGASDILWRATDGTLVAWATNGMAGSAAAIATVPSNWALAGVADLTGDGKADLLWRNADGTVVIWAMDGAVPVAVQPLDIIDPSWKVAALGDLDADGTADILWRNDDGTAVAWRMAGGQVVGGGALGNPGATWRVAALADTNADGRAEIVWRNANGTLLHWFTDDTNPPETTIIGNPGADWQVVGSGDYDRNGKADLVLRNDNGAVVIWSMDGGQVAGGGLVAAPGADWSVAGTGDYDGNGQADLLWRNADGTAVLWLFGSVGPDSVTVLGNPGTDWTIA
ncbi:FG-GAP-like repeat-containing protein [Paracraurococcus ruber]|uniref:Uncharacterized protein n=1 Tax=Paracraurococcus ruber TaxID=77675 RepID=A0ABS1D0K7_9PROT|nr:FG-GAP-like repeat-containing protein [Paracraurococcus ruber]MBK1659812.1 hypothetical protein [Paracraurococcus ruber]TDG31445.1 hypothetical protein E2C05_11040 [Paracraurococcus ruber]